MPEGVLLHLSVLGERGGELMTNWVKLHPPGGAPVGSEMVSVIGMLRQRCESPV
jgi:hypothetical protein